jgi:hypothetical protein
MPPAFNLGIPWEQTYARFEVGAGLTKGPFPITFSIFKKANLRVTVDGVELTQSQFAFSGTEAVGGFSSGNVELSEYVENVEVIVWRDVLAERTTDFAPSSHVPIQAIDTAFDTAMAIAQDLKRDLDRTFRVPVNRTGVEITEGSEGLVAVNADGDLEFLPVASFRGTDGMDGDKGDPGADASQFGTLAQLPGVTIAAPIIRIWSTGHTTAGDGGACWLYRVSDAVTLACDVLDAAGTRWRIARDQVLRPEMCGAKGDAQLIPSAYTDWNGQYRTTNEVTNTPTDDTAAFVRFYDLLNYWQSFRAATTPGRNYFFAPVSRPNVGFSVKTVTLWDGRTTVGSFINTTSPVPCAVSWNGFELDFTGSRVVLDGNFNLVAADYSGGYRLRDTMLPLNMWKCRRGIIKGLEVDGQWRHQTTDTGGSGECFSYAISMTGCAFLTFTDCVLFDMAQDGVAMGHRQQSTYNGIALGSVEGYPEADASTSSVYYAEGRCQAIEFRNPIIGPCRRQGMSPIGVGGRDLANRYPGLNVIGGLTCDIGRNIGQHPKFQTGDPTDGSVKHQWRGFPPRSAFDFEPQRQGPYQVDGVKIIGHRMDGCIGSFVAAQGDWSINRVEQSLPYTAVDVAANSFTKASLTLSAVFPGQIPSKTRCWSDGALPSPLQPKTDYYLFKTSSTVFKLARTYEDALAQVAIDLTDQGSGTHWFVLADSWPNVGEINLIDCTGVHPWDGSLLPWQIYVERCIVQGGAFELKCASAIHGPSSTYRQGLLFRGVELKGQRQIVEFNDIASPKTLTITPASSTITSSTSHLFGKYEFTPIRMKGGTLLPPEFKSGKTYFADRITDTTFRVAASLSDAALGTWIIPSTAGTGTQTCWKIAGSTFEMVDCAIIQSPRDLSFDAALDVDTTNARIHIPMSIRNEGIYPAEILRLQPVVAGVGTEPGGLTFGTNVYPFIDENEPDWVYLATSSANANAGVAIDLTSVGVGRLKLAPSNTTSPINLIDTDVTFTNNRIFMDRNSLSAFGANDKMVSITGCSRIGYNTYDCNITAAAEGRFYTSQSGNLIAIGPDRYPSYDTFYPNIAAGSLDMRTVYPWRATVSFNPTSIATITRSTQTMTVSGVRTGRDTISALVGLESAGLEVTNVWVSADDTVSVTLYNPTGGAIDAGATSVTLSGLRSQV